MGAIEDESAIAGPRRRTQRGIERQRIAGEPACEGESEIGLIDIARADCLLKPREGLFVGAGRNLRVEWADPRLALALLRQIGRDLARRDTTRLSEQAQPDERTCCARPLRGEGRKARLQRKARLVGYIARQRLPGFDPRALSLLERCDDFLRRARDEDPFGPLEQQGIRRTLAARVVEQDHGRAGIHRRLL